MRPLRLEVKNFTAFRDEQAIAFDEHGLDLFAISGQTGSGKSSLLDAITYALYGYVDRVGRQVGQLVSQGQPRMAVTLEFAVDGSRYRVTRSTPVRGNTQILVERGEGDAWIQAGEGADRVGTANEIIRRAVGLDYDAFTRTVLLPQGRFAEFLVGDAKERRAILTDLLGLELFERLGRRAGDLKRDAEAEVKAKTSVLETEYAGVTPEAVAEASVAAEAAEARERSLAEAEDAVRTVVERWAANAKTIADLRTCERDVRDAAATAVDVAAALAELAARDGVLGTEATERGKDVTARERALATAAAARLEAEAAGGRAVDLAAARAKAEALGAARGSLAEAERELADARARVPEAEAVEAAADRATSDAVAHAEVAVAELEAADAALEDARHADLVAAVRAGVHEGDDCPVCGTKVTSLPRSRKAVSLEKAASALERAKVRAEAAKEALAVAEREAHRASEAVKTASAEAARCEKAAAKARAEVDRLQGEVAGALGGTLPSDPIATIDERIARLEQLEAGEEDAQGALDRARSELADVERERTEVAARIAECRGRIGALAVGGLLDRAGAFADGVEPAPAPLTGKEDAPTLAGAAGEVAGLLDRTADTLAAAAQVLGEGEAAVVGEAMTHLEGLVEVEREVPTVAEVLELAVAAHTAASRRAATAAERAASVAQKLRNAVSIASEIAEHRSRAAVFDVLAKELRQDRLIAFLQVEALQLLAAAGSERLSALSQGRYGLGFAGDEFSVVDTWNGEERRSARTLSGGETFLASLALALALSEQVRSLAVTEKARLDSLFLDEGFGTLDPESLEVVVEAIEQLGGDGRMVGVITHVQELAIRLPARVEVEKSPRGSTLRVVV